MKLKVKLSLKSFESNLLNKYIHDVQSLWCKLQEFEKTPSGFFYTAPSPTKVRKFTVLRSPHIDKKSREQFEVRVLQKHLHIGGFTSLLDAHFFIDLLKNSHLVGVQSKACLITTTIV